MPRAERLQLILSLLRSSPGMRPDELAACCRVSTRSIFRDLRALQAMGLPVYFDRGYQLPSPAFLPPLYLMGEETHALRVAAGRAAEHADHKGWLGAAYFPTTSTPGQALRVPLGGAHARSLL